MYWIHKFAIRDDADSFLAFTLHTAAVDRLSVDLDTAKCQSGHNSGQLVTQWHTNSTNVRNRRLSVLSFHR